MESEGALQLSPAQKDELMDQVKQQIAIANAQELLTDMTKKCFNKCVNKPGTSLDSSEQLYSRVFGTEVLRGRLRDGLRLQQVTYTKRHSRGRELGASEVEIPFVLGLYMEIGIRGTLRFANDYETALEMIATGRVKSESLIALQFKIKHVEAFEMVQLGKAIKVTIFCNEQK